MAKKTTKSVDGTDLTQVIYDTLNKDDKVAYFLDGQEETPTDLTGWVSTSSTMLDLAISNRPHAGVPSGRIIEFIGKEGSGKSLIAAHILSNAIKSGGVGVLIDTEAAVNEKFFKAIGLDMNKLIYVHALALEDIYDIVIKIVEKVRATDKDKLVTIVIDSLSGASTKKELEADFDRAGYDTGKALINGTAMRKITGLLAKQRILLVLTSQIRAKMNAMPFGDQWETSGGMAVRFAASCRVFLQPMGYIKSPDGSIIGIKVKGKIIKNRFGPPKREAEFEIYFDRGIDDYTSWLDVLKDTPLMNKNGAWYTYLGDDKERKFQKGDFGAFLEEDAERKELLYQAVCDHYIMKYRSTDDERDFSLLEDEDEETKGSAK